MAKMPSFILTDSGEIIYATGRVVPINIRSELDIVDNRVYRTRGDSRRLYGYLKNPKKMSQKKQRQVKKTIENREKKRKRVIKKANKVIDKPLQEDIPTYIPEHIPFSESEFNEMIDRRYKEITLNAEIADLMPILHNVVDYGIISVAQRSFYNFNMSLKRAVEAGKLSEKEAVGFYLDYVLNTDNKKRTEIWDELHDLYRSRGYEESS